jgi:hypothetical protein
MDNDLKTLGSKLASAQEITILIKKDATLDVMASALALYLTLLEAQKSVTIISPTAPLVRDSHLVGLDQIKTSLPGKNLVLTINVEGDVVDKVTSAVEGGKLSLTIIPKPKTPTITKDDIVFSQSGSLSDLVVIFGAQSLQDLASLKEGVVQLTDQSTSVNITNQTGASFATLNFVDPAASLSELTTAIIQELKLPLTQDIAGNLMRGIQSATNNLQSESLTADTFEALAVLYRAGARYLPESSFTQAKIIDNTPIFEERLQEDKKDLEAVQEEIKDWLKPKIYTTSDK